MEQEMTDVTSENKPETVVLEFIGYKVVKARDKKENWGDCVVHNGVAWFCTELAPVTICKKKSDFNSVLLESKKRWPESRFRVVEAYGEKKKEGEEART